MATLSLPRGTSRQLGATLFYARRRPVWGNPVLRPPAAQTRGDPARRRRRLLPASISPSALFSSTGVPVPQRRGREERKNDTRPRRRRLEQVRVTLSLSPGGIKPCTRDLGPTSFRPLLAWRVYLSTGTDR